MHVSDNHKKNTRRTITNRQAAKKGKSSKSKASTKKNSANAKAFIDFMKSQRMIQIYGIISIAFSILLLVSMFSYFFTREQDQLLLSNPDGTASNLAGKIGFFISYYFVDFIFGIFSIGFVLLFFISGVRMAFNKTILPIFKTTITVILTMSWLSIVIGFFVTDTATEFLAGAFGAFTSQFLVTHTGKLVTLLIMTILFFVILILCYNVSMKNMLFSIPKIKLKKGEKREKGAQKKQKEEEMSATYIYKGNEQADYGKYKEPEQDSELSVVREPEIGYGQKNESIREVGINEAGATGKAEELHEMSGNSGVEITLEPVLGAEAEKDEVPFDIVDNSLLVENEGYAEDDADDENYADLDRDALLEEYDPRKDLSMYKFPPLDLLLDYGSVAVDSAEKTRELTENKIRIENTLKNFKIPIKRISAIIGPTVTLYEIVPDDGVRISKIKNLEDDIALSLAALGIRIIAPIPGRGTIGIEVPNSNPDIVPMKAVISSEKFQNNKFDLPIGLGKTISNEPYVVDLAKMPHLLMAGATGQGKSVGLNAVMTSLLYKKHPAELKFVLVDPKKVELTLYSLIEKHYLAKLPDSEEAIITDTKKVIRTLNSLCIEMDDRYSLLKKAHTRNIKEYNAKFCARKLSPANGHRYLPYIVLIIDEFADLIMTAGREVETPIARLAQLARAIGIHLIIATQRPSVNIITGIIKANFPARLAFRVTSKIDSRTILDTQGADQLIGRGDMLLSTGNDLIRLQCAFVDTPEVENIAKFIEEQQAYPEAFLLPEYSGDENETLGGGELSDEIDEFFIDAATLIVQTQQGSTSLIQRKMKLGYNRAGRIMDQLEEFGIVGPSIGSKAREVKVKTLEELQHIFQSKGMV